MNESLEEMVRGVVAKHMAVEVNEIGAEEHLRLDLHLDPLDLVLIALRLEDMEQREFPIHRLEDVETVRDIARVVEGMRVYGFEEAAFTLDMPGTSTMVVPRYVSSRHAGQRAKRARRLAQPQRALEERCGRVSSRSR